MNRQHRRRISVNFDRLSQIKIAFGDAEYKMKYNKKYSDNKITTTKYNLITWIPKSLLFQFKRIANIYFLIISVLSCFSFTPKNPVTMIGTFSLVLIFTMLKEAYEDMKRYKQDREVNSKKVLTYSEAEQKYHEIMWEEIKVGDIVAVNNEDDVAADLLLLKSSLDSGICFVDTMNIDGETNLKEKYAIPFAKTINYDEILISVGTIITQKPNDNLDKWECFLTFGNTTETVICSMKNLLLKGSKLKNTQKVLGVVIYTGHNTKIMKNSKIQPMKMSNLMKTMNKLLYSVFVFQIILSILFAISYTIWVQNNTPWYLPSKQDSFLIKILTFLLAYSHLIPISLYVALELVKMIQSLLIYFDTKIQNPITNQPAIARTSDLIEELGQVEFIFSDKTGTLTKNEMEFKKCFTNFKTYGGDQHQQNLKEVKQLEIIQSSSRSSNNKINSRSKNTINGDDKAYRIIKSQDEESRKDREALEIFFTICTVCHSAYVEDKNGKRSYQSSSPDEVALLEGAEQIGFEFTKKTTNTIETLSHTGEYIIWELIMELPFDSTRKRMSVIVSQKPGTKNINDRKLNSVNQPQPHSDEMDSNYFLFTKGADSSMLCNMNLSEIIESQINFALGSFSQEGLRTLVMAKKSLNEAQVIDYKEKFNRISMSNDKDKDQKMSSLFEEIETDFQFVGCSAIEDKLQENVATTIEILMSANIRLWVLTGDKKETAVEIGKSCKLICNENLINEIDLASNSYKDDTYEQFKVKLEAAYNKYVGEINHIGKKRDIKCSKIPSNPKLYMIIDGKNLSYVLNDIEIGKKFFSIGLLAKSVICCRVSPKQKSQVVKLAKDNGKWITLAVGDGANDVPMIMEAHIGIGIVGKEGTQAVRSSDYAISQFQYLQRLVLVHGRWGYRRISYFICYYFYKNIVLVFTEIYFASYNGFSGQSFFADILPLCYNAFWTSWACIFAYSIERDVDDETSLKYPVLYKAGQIKFYFTLKKFWIWIIYAIIHGVIVFYCVGFAINNILNDNGFYPDHWAYSTLCFTCIIHIVTIKIFIELLYWNYFNILVSVSSICFYYLCIFLFSMPSISTNFQNELILRINILFINYKSIVSVIFLPMMSLLPDIICRLIQRAIYPTPAEIIISLKNQTTDKLHVGENLNKFTTSVIENSRERILINGGVSSEYLNYMKGKELGIEPEMQENITQLLTTKQLINRVPKKSSFKMPRERETKDYLVEEIKNVINMEINEGLNYNK